MASTEDKILAQAVFSARAEVHAVKVSEALTELALAARSPLIAPRVPAPGWKVEITFFRKTFMP